MKNADFFLKGDSSLKHSIFQCKYDTQVGVVTAKKRDTILLYLRHAQMVVIASHTH
jgi:hypothetical protein